jgi:KDO2-lipid IV(A) lauroyltransferase
VNTKLRVTKVFLKIIASLPQPILYFIASILAFLAQHVFRYRNHVIKNNLRNAFPTYSSEQLKKIESLFYKQFCVVIIEILMQFRMDKEFLKGKVTLTNPELLEKYYQDGRNVVAVCGHFCNWEWIGASLTMHTSYDVLAIYKPLTNKVIDQLLIEIRTLNGTKLTPVKKATRAILSYEKPLISYFIADQSASPEFAYWTDFLNQKTAVFWGAEKIARASNAIVVFLAMRQFERGKYSFDVIELCKDPLSVKEGVITQLHVSALEKEIIKAPEFWLWSHKRWKHKMPQ